MPRGAKGKEKEKEKEEEVSTKKTQQKSSSKPQKKELTKEQKTERIRKRLSDRAYLGRNVSQDKLASRLGKLYSYLCDRKQKDDENEDGEEDKEPELDIIAAQLIQSHLLENSENNIKILTACCLYDIFRVYAPDAPYGEEQLEPLFRMFIDQLAGLEKGPNNVHFNRRLYLLNGLDVVKAFTVLPAIDELVVHMFRTFFDIIYGLRDQPIVGVTTQLSEILALYFEDSQVSSTLLDEIFDALTGRGKESPVLHSFISNVIKNSADRLHEPITKYLNDLLEHQSDSDARERCHQIVFEVNKISPNLLLYVMPQLEAQLTVENDEIRTELVRLLSRMFGHRDSALHTTYRKLFEAFLKRFTDKNEQIRETMLDFLAHYLKYHNDYAAEFSNLLAARLRDPVEDVRHKAVTTACEIAENRPEVLTEIALDELFLRMRDRKSAIRKELTVKLGLIYRDMIAKHRTTELPTSLRGKYMLIPSKVLQNYTVPGEELRVDQVMDECLLFQQKPSAEKKAKMLVELVQNLAQEGTHKESASFTAFTRLLKEKKAFQAEFNRYLTLRNTEDLDDDDEDAPISRQLRVLSQLLPVPNPDKSYEFFQKMNKMEKKIFSYLTTIGDLQETFAKQATARTELLTKLGKKSVQYDHMLAVTQKLRHTAVSSESIPFILKALAEELELDTSAALPVVKLVELLSSLYPEFFHESFQELSELLDNSEVLDRALAIIGNIGAHFKITAASSKSVTKKLTALLSGGTPYQARHSVRALHSLFPTTDVFSKILKELVESLDESANLATVLSALGQIAKLEPAEFKKHSSKVIEFVSDEVLSGKVTKPSPRKPKKKGSPVANKTRPVSGDLKGFGAQLLAKYLEGRHSLEKQESDAVSSKFIGLIMGIIEDGNEVQDDEDDEQRRVDSVVAACAALLRIAAIRRYEHVFLPQQFETFAWVARDSSADVRRGFSIKLFNRIKEVKLHVRYLAIPSLFVLDKDHSANARAALATGIKARRTFIKTNPEFIEKNQSARTEFTPEYALLHLIHLIAHCPDFKGDSPAYNHTSRYLSFFTNEIIQELDHFYFLKTLLENLKLTKDAVATQSSNFLVVNEVAILTLQEKSEHRNWKPTNKKFPVDFLYPSTIFLAPKAGSEPDAPKRYLPQGWKLPDQSRRLLSGAAAGGIGIAMGGGGGAAAGEAGGEKHEKHEKPEKEKPKAASKPTPKRRLVYEKEDAPAKNKKKKATAKSEKSNVALRPRRTIQSYFEKSQSDDEEVEEESEEEYEKPSRKATSPKRASPKNAKKKEKEEESEEGEEEKEEEKPKKQPAGNKGKGKKEEKEESEEEEEKEEKPKKQPAAKKGKGKGKGKKEEEEEGSEEEEKEEKPKKQPTAKKGKGKGKKEEVEEEEEKKEESEEEEKRGKKQNGKTKESPAGRKKRKASEEESEEEVVEKKKTKKGK